ncbi:MAG: AbrB/MazE/SpoVT family DNA-binding domain-containing protein [Acetatifactor sp.]|nr:AbrB/MazE/SpoVT family DNA-binding domain-containing protein [Acetatifactor sp.]
MTIAKVFENGRSQAVRLPKEYRFSDDEVLVNKIGEIVMLIPKSSKWSGFLSGLSMFSDDFMANDREDQTEQEREEL